MCGIAGLTLRDPRELSQTIQLMIDRLTQRGPDDHGTWCDEEARLALGHRRLSILDLSPLGRQPMVSASGRFVLTFNGEIYNFRDLRRVLEDQSYPFRGGSDSEVMLAAFEVWGVAPAIERFVGMFAFAVWDRDDRVLTLARDRMGEKPIYFTWTGQGFAFASQISALQEVPGCSTEIDTGALSLYLRHNYIPAPHTILRNVFKLLPGTFLRIGQDALYSSPQSFSPWPEDRASLKPTRYWSLAKIARHGRSAPCRDSEHTITDQLEKHLENSIKGQMVADVPVGAFLSGGIDSSLTAALMQRHSSQPVRTFAIGFSEQAWNEAPFAKGVADYLGTTHTELVVTPTDVMKVVPSLAEIFDEPFADSSQIPTFLVSRLARESVTVSLSGDGADELFGGYPLYFLSQRLWNLARVLPPSLRRILATAGSASIEGAMICGRTLGSSSQLQRVLERYHRAARAMTGKTREEVYRNAASHCTFPERLVHDASFAPTVLTDPRFWWPESDFLDEMMMIDQISYLPDDILTKVDRASMAVSLESRAPFLDHRLVEFAWSIPRQMTTAPGTSKRLLRKILSKYLPTHLTERRKQGFAVPLGQWLRTGLSEWAEDTLHSSNLQGKEYIDTDYVTRLWQQHREGHHDYSAILWNLLMFEGWLRNFRLRAERPNRLAA